ncbi:Flavodoxin [Desulfatibacillum alkenivorans DSM 16219]|jgi:ferredoxin/flavodoxin|uniref:Flavodoxin n=1 Tax=Desulfatibacillum alkenivorans DSM 16219 TaxID=1121393 RepID=A0A1M6FS30_9BACT|nr:EFR1 family ferrodoxin [Desulfatibacillum alkenivorans]SHJ00419.1 Flavodoxin [Desulfatibacillum alkenivorans DSM 16219]
MTQEKQRTALVIYHSNTGNTATLAKEAAATLEDMGWAVNQTPLEKAPKIFPGGNPDLLLMGTPIHFWQVPVPAMEMIRKLPNFPGAGAFVFLTYGTVFDGNAPHQLAVEVEKKGAKVLGGASVLSPHNFKMTPDQRLGDLYEDFGKGQPDQQVLADFRAAVRAAASKVESGVQDFNIKDLRSPKPVITFLDGLMPVSMQKKALPKVTWVEESCKDCGMCVENCTTGSIRSVNGKITTNHDTCYRCYQCLWTCKSQARTVNLSAMAGVLRGLKKVVKNPGTRIMV